MSPACTHHLPPSPRPAVLHGTPKTEPQTLSFGFLVQTLPPALALANAQHPRHLHVTNPHPPPPTITLCHRFIWHPQNRATNTRFWFFFGPNPALWPHISKRAAPPLPLCHQLTPTTSHHHPALLFYTAPPKPSHKCSVLGFWSKPCPPASHWRMRSTHTTSMSPTCTHHLPPSPRAAILHSTSETKPQTLGFGFLVQTPHPGLALANVLHPRRLHVINLHPPPPTITPCCHFTRHP
jgi:hypothetical protein